MISAVSPVLGALKMYSQVRLVKFSEAPAAFLPLKVPCPARTNIPLLLGVGVRWRPDLRKRIEPPTRLSG